MPRISELKEVVDTIPVEFGGLTINVKYKPAEVNLNFIEAERDVADALLDVITGWDLTDEVEDIGEPTDDFPEGKPYKREVPFELNKDNLKSLGYPLMRVMWRSIALGKSPNPESSGT